LGGINVGLAGATGLDAIFQEDGTQGLSLHINTGTALVTLIPLYLYRIAILSCLL